MSQSNPMPTNQIVDQADSRLNRPRTDEQVILNATWAAALLSLAAVAFFIYAITTVNFRDWEDYILVGFPLILAGASLGSIVIMRRGRLGLGSGIIFSLNLLVPLLLSLLLSNTLWPALLYGAVSSLLIIWRAMPRQSWLWSAITTAVVLIAVIIVNVINPPGRFAPPPEIELFFAVVIAVLVAAFLVQAARQAWAGNIQVKMITGFTIVAVASLGIMGTVTYLNYRNQVREDIRQRLLNIVSVSALNQDGDLHATLRNTEDTLTEVYNQIMAANDAILATDLDLVFVYTMRQNEDGQIYFIIDANLDPTYESVAVGTVYEEPSDLLVENFAILDRAIVEEDFYTDEFGSFLSAYAPFYRADGTREGIVGVDIAANDVVALERNVLLLILGTAGAAMLAVTLLGLWLGSLFTKPVVNLSRSAQQIADGDLSARAVVETTDEIGSLAQVLNTMTSQLQVTLQGLEQRVAERTRNLELAAEVGRSVSQLRELDVMLKDACNLILNEFELYYVQVYLVDPSQAKLKLEAGTGEVGAQLLGRGHSLLLNTGSINGRAALEKRPVVISDTAKSATFRPNELLPETRGEMAVPLIVADRVVGVLDMQSSQPGVLNEEVLPAFEALAGQMAVAVQNASLLADAEQARAQLEAQARRLVRAGWRDYLDAIHMPEQIGFVFEQNLVAPLAPAEDPQAPENGNAISVPIAVTGEPLGSLVVEIDDEDQRELSNELVIVVARQVAQQIENLRLLESAERYRYEAEQAIRLQTIEGWQEYIRSRPEGGMGYLYNQVDVRPQTVEQLDSGSGLTVPVKARDEVVGKLAVEGISEADTEAVELANAVAERLGAHIENLRLFEETKRGQFELDRRARQLAAVAQVSTASSRQLDVQKILETVVYQTQRQFGLYHAHIFILNEITQELRIAACGWKEGDEQEGTHETGIIPISREQSLVARAAQTRRPVLVNDVRSDPNWLPNPLLPDTRSELAVPLLIGDRVLGVLDVQSAQLNAFTEEDANIQLTLASQVAVSLQNAYSFTQAQKQAEREALLNTINQKIQSATSVEAVLQIAARELGHALNVPRTIAQISIKDQK